MSDAPPKDLSARLPEPAHKVAGMRVGAPHPHPVKHNNDAEEDKRLKDKEDADAHALQVQNNELDNLHSGHSKQELGGGSTKLTPSQFYPPTQNQHTQNHDVRGQHNRSHHAVNQPGGKQGHDSGFRASQSK